MEVVTKIEITYSSIYGDIRKTSMKSEQKKREKMGDKIELVTMTYVDLETKAVREVDYNEYTYNFTIDNNLTCRYIAINKVGQHFYFTTDCKPKQIKAYFQTTKENIKSVTVSSILY